MCFTSGTTGRCKGVVYSHRSTVLHALGVATTSPLGLRVAHGDTLLPVVPMFHANAWGYPYLAAMLGTKLVFPGPHLDPESLLDASELKDRLADAIAALPEREKLVIALYYYENLTLREIGEVLGVTESRISQLHTKAVLRLKSRLQGDNLRD